MPVASRDAAHARRHHAQHAVRRCDERQQHRHQHASDRAHSCHHVIEILDGEWLDAFRRRSVDARDDQRNIEPFAVELGSRVRRYRRARVTSSEIGCAPSVPVRRARGRRAQWQSRASQPRCTVGRIHGRCRATRRRSVLSSSMPPNGGAASNDFDSHGRGFAAADAQRRDAALAAACLRSAPSSVTRCARPMRRSDGRARTRRRAR